MGIYHPPVEQHETVVATALGVVQATHYSPAGDRHEDAAYEYAIEQLALASRALAEAVDSMPADEQPIGWTKDREIERDAIHRHFGLSYANYLVLPRTLLQSMPQEWQAKFVALLDEMTEAFAHVPQAEAYTVAVATEHIVKEMSDEELAQASITQSWEVEGEPPVPPWDKGYEEWRAAHRKSEPTYYDAALRPLDPNELVLLPVADPVPHYNRGRTRIEPRPGGAS